MALSLADELASAFDDPQEIQLDQGQSLAAEFGQDIDDEVMEHDDLDAEFDQEDGTPPYSPTDHPNALPDLSKLYNRHETPSRTRTAKSSSSSTIVAPSIYSELQDELPPIPDLAYSPIPNRTHHPNTISTPPPKLRTKLSRTSFLNPKIEKDPMVSLQEGLDCTTQFIRRLKSYEEIGEIREDDLVGRMEKHLEALGRSEKIREEQCRELSGIIQAVGNFGMLDSSLLSGGGLGFGVFDEVAEEIEEGVGWNAESLKSSTIPLRDGITHLHTLEEGDSLDGPDMVHTHKYRLEDDSDSYDPQDRISPEDDAAHMFSRDTTIPPPAQKPNETALDKLDIHAPLLALLETLSHNSSFSVDINRQLRKTKAFTQSWREREAMVESARRKVDIWEEERLERGLKGVWMGDALRDEVEGLKVVFEGIERRIEGLKRIRA